MYDLNDPDYVADYLRRHALEQPEQKPPTEPTQEDLSMRHSRSGPMAPEWSRRYTDTESKKGTIGPVAKYPWRTMPVNGTFQIPPGPDQPSYRGLQSTCWTKSKILCRKFRVHQYEDGTIEVWRER